jgi:hypothetical protein
MSDWGWVAFAYLVVFGTLGTYAGWLVTRLRRERR